jgi:putrescine transport system substrate-binding protein
MKQSTILFFSLLFLTVFSCKPVFAEEEKVLNVYTWRNLIPKKIIDQFEKETGIKVSQDYYDSNDILEAKLLLGKTGYDLVFPSLWPFFARQVPANLYKKIDKTKLTNFKKLDRDGLRLTSEADPDNLYGVPFIWGAVAFGYNVDKIKEVMPDAPVDSWAMFFDPNVVKKFENCGVTLLEEAIDVFVPTLLYLQLDPEASSKKDIDKAVEVLQKIRPYVSRFDASRGYNELAVGDMCLVQHWISTFYMAYYSLPEKQRPNIKFVIPKEGTEMWIDVVAIPADAKHPDNATQFINFLLRPEVMAEISNTNYTGNFIPESKKFISKEIKSNKLIFPDKKDMNKFIMAASKTPEQQKLLTRAMTKVRTGK